MSRGSLEPVRERIAWARERFQQFEAASDAFMGVNADGVIPLITRRADVNSRTFVVTASVPGKIPSALPRLTGEILHHLRGAIDNLAWQLVLANGETPGRHTEFPVALNLPAFQATAPRRLRGMSAAAVLAVEELQPFNAWPEYPQHSTLWVIHHLNVIDKHRLPHLCCLWLATIEWKVFGAEPTMVSRRERGCVEDGSELMRIVFASDDVAAPDVGMKLTTSFDIAVRNPGQVEFTVEGPESVEAAPVRRLFEVGFDYIENTLIPAFASEFPAE